MTTITANVSQMFMHIEPWDVSNCVMDYGPNVGPMTWANAQRIAENHAGWLESHLADAVEGMREWARETGAWERAEIAAWSDVECLALFAQNIASELREHLDVDNNTLHECVALYERTDWQQECAYPIGSYYVPKDSASTDVRVDYYTGM